jgi:hypothetical protein
MEQNGDQGEVVDLSPTCYRIHLPEHVPELRKTGLLPRTSALLPHLRILSPTTKCKSTTSKWIAYQVEHMNPPRRYRIM